MFSPDERAELRDALLAGARADERITAAALVGSAVRGTEDVWSDIDLMFRLADGLTPEAVADDWAAWLRAAHRAVAQTDIWAGPALYRVFLIENTLQVDLSFWPSADFASSGPPIQLVFGEANDARPAAAPDQAALLGTAWLYALHARSSIARRRHLQAMYMIDAVRHQVITLASVRHDLPAAHARGADDLPPTVRAPISDSIVRELTEPELRRAFETLVGALLVEARRLDPAEAARLAGPMRELVRTARAPD